MFFDPAFVDTFEDMMIADDGEKEPVDQDASTGVGQPISIEEAVGMLPRRYQKFASARGRSDSG